MTRDQTNTKANEIVEVMDAWGIDKPDQLSIAQGIVRLVYASMRRQTRQRDNGNNQKDTSPKGH
jgi:hypothetical protein